MEDLFNAGIAGDLSDGELLDRFLRCADDVGEAAFRGLVERHGPMVFRVCRQVLNDAHATEDAVQATFLVLVNQAGKIRKQPSVSSWLFGVARRASARIRMQEARRRRYELRSAERTSALSSARQEPPDSDHYPELHAEIERLPEKYRVPIVLCYFEGLTHEQAASRLRWPVGTLKTRLSRARERLRSRLERPGRPFLLLLPASPLRLGNMAEIPVHLVSSITKAGCQYATKGISGGLVSSAVLKVTEEVMKSMLITKLKWAATCWLVSSFWVSALWSRLSKPRERDRPVKPTWQLSGAMTRLPRCGFPAGSTSARTKRSEIRPPLDGRVDKVYVGIGERVKKGDPLVELFSTDLAAAKNDYEVARVQHAHDKRLLELKSRLVASNSHFQWVVRRE